MTLHPLSPPGDPRPRATGPACLLIHGFTSSPREMAGLARYLEGRGIATSTPLLPGHGTTPEDLRGKTWHDWYGAVTAALDELQARHTRVYIAGLSLGGTLALYAASQRGKDLAGIVAMSAPIYFIPGLLFILRQMQRRLPYLGKPFRDIQDPHERARHGSYLRAPVDAAASVVEFVSIVRACLQRVLVPALIIYARRDHVVHPLNSRYIYARIHSRHRRLIALRRGFHIVTVDKDRRKVYASVYEFIKDTEACR